MQSRRIVKRVEISKFGWRKAQEKAEVRRMNDESGGFCSSFIRYGLTTAAKRG
jgi:hypothetical protein